MERGAHVAMMHPVVEAHQTDRYSREGHDGHRRAGRQTNSDSSVNKRQPGRQTQSQTGKRKGSQVASRPLSRLSEIIE